MNKFLIILTASIALSGASITAQNIQSENIATTEIVVTAKNQKLWDKGNQLEAKGLTAYEKARKNLIESSSDVVKAQNKRDSSAAQSDRASAEFRNLTSVVPNFSNGEDAKKWSESVNNAASEWAKYADRRIDGRDDLTKSSKAQNKAQEQVDKAQAMIDRGRAMKTQAVSLSASPL